MLGATFFLAFWIILGLGFFFTAVRGGPRGARDTLQTQSPGGRRAATVTFVVLYVILGALIPTALLLGNHDNASAQVKGVKLSTHAKATYEANGKKVTVEGNEKRGRTLFGEQCGVCHTLSEANADGQVGPNLDQLKPNVGLVINALQLGRQRGNGTMPANILPDQDDQNDVALFVAKVAGR
jgi:mono/diheme cytochrome c family protein